MTILLFYAADRQSIIQKAKDLGYRKIDNGESNELNFVILSGKL